MQIIFDYNTNSPKYPQVLSAFKEAVEQDGGVLNDYGMGVQGVDPTFTLHDNTDQGMILDRLVAEGYTVAFSGADSNGCDGPISITPPRF